MIASNALSLWFDLQKTALDAHEANMAAAKQGMKSLDAAVSMQKAMAKASEANLKAMNDWARLWGVR